ncbi:hypothetical protein FQK03_18405 [Acinetobacter baumannii]|nr:hypothetical protein FQK03_18405 [Acinetobacter baumannii]
MIFYKNIIYEKPNLSALLLTFKSYYMKPVISAHRKIVSATLQILGALLHKPISKGLFHNIIFK